MNAEYGQLRSIQTSEPRSIREKSVKKEVKEYQPQQIQSPIKEGISLNNVQVLEYASPPKNKAFQEKSSGARIGNKGDSGVNVTVLTHQSKTNQKEYPVRNDQIHNLDQEHNHVDTEREVFENFSANNKSQNYQYAFNNIDIISAEQYALQAKYDRKQDRRKQKSQVKRENKLQEELDKILSNEFMNVLQSDYNTNPKEKPEFIDFNQLAIITESNLESSMSMSQFIIPDHNNSNQQHVQQYQQQQYYNQTQLSPTSLQVAQQFGSSEYLHQPYGKNHNPSPFQQKAHTYNNLQPAMSLGSLQQPLKDYNQQLKDSFQLGDGYLEEERKYLDALKQSSDRSHHKKRVPKLEVSKFANQSPSNHVQLRQLQHTNHQQSTYPQIGQQQLPYDSSNSNHLIEHSGSTNDNAVKQRLSPTDNNGVIDLDDIKVSPLELAQQLEEGQIKQKESKQEEVIAEQKQLKQVSILKSGKKGEGQTAGKCQSCCTIF